MAFNGTGLFTRVFNWVNDRNAAIPITAARMDQEMDGFATGLSNCLLKDGTQTVTANLPMNSKKITQLADATASGDAVHFGMAASETRAGVIELATSTEAITGTDAERTLTPATAKASAAAWLAGSGSQAAAPAGVIDIPSGYEWVEVLLDNITTSVAGGLQMTISTNSGVSYLSAAAYFYALMGKGGSAADLSSVGTANALIALSGSQTTATRGSLHLRLPAPSGALGAKIMHAHYGYLANGGDWAFLTGICGYNSADDITNLRFAFSGGGNLTFNYRVIGYR